MTSLRGRLTIAIVMLVAVVLAGLAVVLYVGARRAAWDQHDHALVARARALAVIAEYENDGYEMSLPPEAEGATPSYIEVWEPNGDVLARSASLHDGDLAPTEARLRHPVVSDVTLPDGRAGRAIGMRFVPRHDPRTENAGELALVLAEGTEDVEAAGARIRAWFIVFGIAALALIALLTMWLLGRGLRPLTELAAQLELIDDRNLAVRIATDQQPIELEVPIRKLNELFARLEASFAREREFTADVSHELRTPLAGLRTLLEVTALTDRTTDEYRTAVADAHAIVLQLGSLVENLLMLARLDAGHLQIEKREVSLASLVDECWKLFAAQAAARSLEFRNAIRPNTVAVVDREKLRIVVANLLANAAEYTTEGGWIEVTTGGGALLDVVDSGPPIPDEQIDRIFDRLWRGDAARSATGVHCGVGLALARSLCMKLDLELGATTRDDGCVRFRIATRGN